jgi:hypothetical protein
MVQSDYAELKWLAGSRNGNNKEVVYNGKHSG